VLGEEQAKKLKDHVRNEKGIVQTDKLTNEILDIFQNSGEEQKLLILAQMIKVDENALICDLAETYQIFNYKQIPPSTVAIFAIGLRDDSRIKMKLSGAKVSPNILLLSGIVDRLNLLLWSKTKMD